jgi:hypothetical protein
VAESEIELRMLGLEARVSELELRLRALGACVDELASALALGRNGGAHPAGNPEASFASVAIEGIDRASLPGGLQRVIELVQDGQTAAAQRELYNLPEAELQSHQNVVALIATALFIQRGDFQTAKKVLASAVQATGDPRLSRLLVVVENYSPA